MQWLCFLKESIIFLADMNMKENQSRTVEFFCLAKEHAVVPTMPFLHIVLKRWLSNSERSYSSSWKLGGRARETHVRAQDGHCGVQQRAGSFCWKLHLACPNHKVFAIS